MKNIGTMNADHAGGRTSFTNEERLDHASDQAGNIAEQEQAL